MKINNSAIRSRTRVLVDSPVNEKGEFVLYWMTAQRRLRWNHALEHAADVAERFATDPASPPYINDIEQQIINNFADMPGRKVGLKKKKASRSIN